MNEEQSNYITAKEIIKRANETETDFSFKSKLLILNIAVKIASNKKPYLDMTVRDITDLIRKIRRWYNTDEEHLKDRELLDVGIVFEINATYVKEYSSVTIHNYRILGNEEYNLEDFIKEPDLDASALIHSLDNAIFKIKNHHLRELLELIFHDRELRKKFISCPSSVGHHHAYKHGNLEHTIGMLKTFENFEEYYKGDTLLNIDLIYAGILIHDIAKIKEYKIKNGIAVYDNPGLSHHTDIGREIVLKKIEQIDDFPKFLENIICNIIVSHHKKIEWDSLEEPGTDEAKIVHYLDMIDSRFKRNIHWIR